MRRTLVVVTALASLAGACIPPSHHVSRMGDRRSARAEPCREAELETFTDRGPDRPIERFAVVTSECGESKESECLQHLRMGGCEAGADALIDVTNRVVRGRRRMMGTAVEYVSEDGPAPSSGGAAPR